jgi:hypothetical protein
MTEKEREKIHCNFKFAFLKKLLLITRVSLGRRMTNETPVELLRLAQGRLALGAFQHYGFIVKFLEDISREQDVLFF